MFSIVFVLHKVTKSLDLFLAHFFLGDLHFPKDLDTSWRNQKKAQKASPRWAMDFLCHFAHWCRLQITLLQTVTLQKQPPRQQMQPRH
jgi:hypothetical protein